MHFLSFLMLYIRIVLHLPYSKSAFQVYIGSTLSNQWRLVNSCTQWAHLLVNRYCTVSCDKLLLAHIRNARIMSAFKCHAVLLLRGTVAGILLCSLQVNSVLKSLLISFTRTQNALTELWRSHQMKFCRKSKPKLLFFGDFFFLVGTAWELEKMANCLNPFPSCTNNTGRMPQEDCVWFDLFECYMCKRSLYYKVPVWQDQQPIIYQGH